jgi:hypothetical protein
VVVCADETCVTRFRLVVPHVVFVVVQLALFVSHGVHNSKPGAYAAGEEAQQVLPLYDESPSLFRPSALYSTEKRSEGGFP